MFRISCWMISTLSTVQRAMSLQDQTSSHVILKRTPVHGTTTTLPAFCGKGLKGDFMRDQMRKVSKQELSIVVTVHLIYRFKFPQFNSHTAHLVPLGPLKVWSSCLSWPSGWRSRSWKQLSIPENVGCSVFVICFIIYLFVCWLCLNIFICCSFPATDYYMLITAKRNLDIASAARLISFPQPAGQVICVSFWYHIFGNSIGSWL